MGDGARLAERWHGHSPDTWRERWGVPALRIYHQVGSTNDVVRSLAEQGAPAGTVVLADTQTGGRGRRGRRWLGTPDGSLLLSVLLRPPQPSDALRSGPPSPTADGGGAALPLRVGLAAARAAERVAGVEIGLKWPNDLLLGERKVGGILCEGALEGGRRLYLVAGVGINVLQQDDEWPPEIQARATSLARGARQTAGRAGGDRRPSAEDDAPRELDATALPRLAEAVITGILAMAGTGAGELTAAELKEIETRDTLLGRPVAIDGRYAGTAIGVDRLGALLVQRDGRTHRIITGTARVHDARPEGEGEP